MRTRRRSLGTLLLAATLSVGIAVPRPARANAAPLLALGGLEGSKAFIALANPYVAVGVGVIVLGIAGYQYYQSNAAEKWDDDAYEAPAPRGPDIRIVPDPPDDPGKGPSSRDTILEILSAAELLRQLDRELSKTPTPQNSDDTKTKLDQKPKKDPNKDPNKDPTKDPDAEVEAGPEVFPGTVVLHAKKDAIPPPRFGIKDAITPQMIGHIMNSGAHTYPYHHGNRYGPRTEWGAFNPDVIGQWSKDPKNAAFVKAVSDSKDALRSFVKTIPDFKADSEKVRLDSRGVPPPGVDETLANAEIDQIEIDFSRFRYHNAFQRIYDFFETIREIETIPEQKPLTDYWKSELNKRVLGPDGMPQSLPLQRAGQKRFDRSTEAGNRAATLASELLLTKNKVRAAWSYTAAKDGLAQSDKPENAARIAEIANAVETFEVTSDRLIDDLLDLSHGQGSGSLSADELRELTQSAAQMGEKLEHATEPMEKTIGDWNRREVPKIYPEITPPELDPKTKEIPAPLEQERNWRRLIEIVRLEKPVSNDEAHYGPTPGQASKDLPSPGRDTLDDAPSAFPEPKINPPPDEPDLTPGVFPPNVEPKAPLPEPSTPAPTTAPAPATAAPPLVLKDLKKILDVVELVLDELNRRGVRDKFGNVFEIVEVLDSKSNNDRDADPAHGSFTKPGTKKDTVVLVLRNKTAIRVARGHHGKSFTFDNNKYYGAEKDMRGRSGKLLTRRQFKRKYSTIHAPKRIAVVEFEAGHLIRASITSSIAGGSGGELQYKIEKPIPGRYRLISDDPLLP